MCLQTLGLNGFTIYKYIYTAYYMSLYLIYCICTVCGKIDKLYIDACDELNKPGIDRVVRFSRKNNFSCHEVSVHIFILLNYSFSFSDFD